VHGVDAPLCTRAVMLGVPDAIQDRIAQVDVGRGHVDACAQAQAAVGVPAFAHFAQPAQRFVGGAVAPGRIGAGLGERAARGADLFGALFINVGVTGLYESLGKLIHVLKVVAGEVQVFFFAVMPVETQPLHHVDDGFDVFGFFLFGIGVVETQVTGALIV